MIRQCDEKNNNTILEIWGMFICKFILSEEEDIKGSQIAIDILYIYIFARIRIYNGHIIC